MKKTLSLIFSLVLLAGQAIAQHATIVENAQKSQYENTSYLVVGSLTLKPGFKFNSASQGTFFARAYDNNPSNAPSGDRNFVRSEVIYANGITTDDQVIGLDAGNKSTSYTYMDGLGRELQSVGVQASPGKKDIVQPVYYDAKGRQSRAYLSYTATGSSGGFRTSALNEQASFYNSPPAGIPSDSKAYATTTFEDSPLERVLSTTNVGNDFQNAAASGRFSVNTAGTVRKWEIINGLPRSTATYPAGSLSVQTGTDEAGAVSRTYTDFAGRTVLEQVQSTASAWLSTYYVYNDYGELLFIIPPQSAATLTPDQTFVNLWHFQYEYDEMGRQIGSKAPGAGWVYTIYDRWDRPVLTQDAEQRARSAREWSFMKYDIHNRPVMSGTYIAAQDMGPLRTTVAAATGRFETRNTTAIGYTLNGSFPTVAEANLISITYYDDYGFRNNNGWSPNNGFYVFAAESGYLGQQLAPGVKGLATGSKSRTQGANTAWMYSVTYYDKYYRPIQSISSHQMGGTVKTSTQYAFSGEVEKNVDSYTHNGSSTRVERRYTYDHAGRPLKIYHKVNTNPEVMLSHFQYNELGQATDIIHHSRNDGRTWLYRTSLKSTIQGWTDEIRYMYSNGDQVFRQKLDYQKASGTGNSPRLDGLATANQWKHYGAEPERAYNYTYDLPKRLTASSYRQKSGTSWSSNNFYTENGIVYSANGNITALARYREKAGASAHIDQLAYSYNGNQLTGVSDSAPAAHKADGFRDGTASGADYTYNGNGFLASDKNKGVTSIVYNILDLPTQVNLGSNSIKYTYSAGGGLMTVAYQGTDGFPNKTIQYVGELVFEGTVLKEIRHGSGRVLADAGYKYQYNLADHLGSTRVVLQENPANFTVTATFEQASMEEESMQFMDYDNSVKIASDLFDHTGTEEAGQALRLIGGETGPARSVSVLPGDTVKMEVYAKYLDLSQTKTNPALMAVAASLAGGSPAVMGIEGGLSAPGATSASGSNGLVGLLTGKQQNEGAPPAYLNYLFFDKEMNYKYGGFVQMSEAAQEDGTGRQHERLYQEAVAEEAGYFYIYLSNESTEGGEAFFDDFGITTLESYIVQQTDYYPYGLTARNYVRAGEKETFDLFQGKTYEQLTGWHDFHARQYDAALGRWFGVDPQNQFASPYLAMGNNPVMMVDPDGELAFLAIAAIIGKAAAVGAGMGAASYALGTAMTGQSWNWGQFAGSIGKGAAIGGLTAGAGLGFSAGLNSMGMGVQASNFIGGALGSFTGNLAGGGMPQSPMEWATAVGSAAMTGNAFKNSNPLGLKRTGNDFSLLGPSEEFIDLPSVTFSNMDAGSYPAWWGRTGLFSNPIAKAISLQGFYNGFVDAVDGFFAGDSPEVNWYRQNDGGYLPLRHSQFVGGEGPSFGAGKFGAVRSSYQKAKYLKELAKSGKSPKWMNQWLQKGKVPPGHHVDHIKPLSIGGADRPFNMRLQNIMNHRTHHKFYRPWLRR